MTGIPTSMTMVHPGGTWQLSSSFVLVEDCQRCLQHWCLVGERIVPYLRFQEQSQLIKRLMVFADQVTDGAYISVIRYISLTLQFYN